MKLQFLGVAGALLSSLMVCSGEPKNPTPGPVPIEPGEGARQARALIARLLAQKPSQSSTSDAVVKIRGADHQRRELPVRFAVVATPTNYLNIYETTISTNSPGGTKLTIVHSDEQPNQYLLSEPGAAAAASAEPRALTNEQLMMPFAGSDFWVADLGLEFLHWPQQRVLRKEMRREVFCAVLQSINPHPVPGGYAKVISWIGTTHPDETVLVHADGYDAAGNSLKEFTPKSLEKVNGAYQLESMEMRNAQTDSRTVIEFNLKPEAK